MDLDLESSLLAVQKSVLRLVGTLRAFIGPHSWKLQDWLRPAVSVILLVTPVTCTRGILWLTARWRKHPETSDPFMTVSKDEIVRLSPAEAFSGE